MACSRRETFGGGRGAASAPRAWWLVASLVAAWGCASEAAPRCRFGPSHDVGTAGLGADEVALVATRGSTAAFWSGDSGFFARALDATGAPISEPRRIGSACDAGLAVAPRDSGWLALCGRRAQLDKGQQGSLTLIALDRSLRPTRTKHVASLGRDASGGDLARHADGTWSVVWHDGALGAWNVWRSRLRFEADEVVDAEPLSSGVLAASPRPRVVVHEDRAHFVFEEFWLDAGFARGRVLVARERGAPVAVEELEDRDARAQLLHDGRSWILVFRDLRRPSPRPSLFARRLGDDLRPIEPARRVTRADADGSPEALTCGGRIVVVVPRTWDTDILVGIDVLDARLRKIVAEQQVYEWSARFPLADAICEDGGLVALVAARARAGDGEAPLHTIGLRCAL